MRYLASQRLRPEYFEPTRKQILDLLYQIIYKPLISTIETHTKHPVILNAAYTALESALRTGRVQYHKGIFSGELNARIGKELRDMGATYDRRSKIYRIPEDHIPLSILNIAETTRKVAEYMHDDLKKKLDAIGQDIDVLVDQYDLNAYKPLMKMHTDFTESARELEITPELSEQSIKDINAKYTDNLKPYIKDFAKKQVLTLREDVEANAMTGLRYDNLYSRIRQQYGVTENKAHFLARQETGLFLAQYRKERFQESNVRYYKWICRGQGMTRENHWKLHDRIFNYDHPPIVDEATGRRCNPGEDFNCIPENSNIEIAYGIEKCFRRWYTGKLTEVVLGSGKTIRATPNHQALTLNGWKAIGLLNNSDYIIDLSEQLIQSSETNINNRIFTISEIFQSMSKLFKFSSCEGIRSDFHGDGIECNVDIIDTAGSLSFKFNARFLQCAQMLRDAIGIKADNLCDFFKKQPFGKQFSRVAQVSERNFSGHIFNLQTKNNWYTTNGIIIHNCMCVDRPIIGEVQYSMVA